jgi:hypothetical protein
VGLNEGEIKEKEKYDQNRQTAIHETNLLLNYYIQIPMPPSKTHNPLKMLNSQRNISEYSNPKYGSCPILSNLRLASIKCHGLPSTQVQADGVKIVPERCFLFFFQG